MTCNRLIISWLLYNPRSVFERGLVCKSLWDKLLAVTERDAATPQSVAEGTVSGSSIARRTATGTKTGLSVALAGRKVRQRSIIDPNRGSGGTSRELKHSIVAEMVPR